MWFYRRVGGYWVQLESILDIENCPNCGGALKIIAAIKDPPVIVRILTHLGLPTNQFALTSIPIYVVSILPIYLHSTFA
jgi:hypothetical protein